MWTYLPPDGALPLLRDFFDLVEVTLGNERA